MRLVFTFITCLAMSGAFFETSSGAAVSKTVNVTMGENITLLLETAPGLGNVRKLSVRNCENGTDLILYCSFEEKIRGCFSNTSERFSIQINTTTVSVTLLDARASDENCYVFSVTGTLDVRNTQVNVKVYGVPLVPTDTPRTDGPFTISLNLLCMIAGGIACGIIVPYLVIIMCWCQKKKKNTQDLHEVTPFTSNINGAVKPDTDESLETVDETSLWMDKENLRSKDLYHGA